MREEELEPLETVAERVQSRQDLAQLLRMLAEDLRRNPDQWEGPTLGRYLEALSAWTDDMDGYFVNVRGEPPPAEPTWKLVGMMLVAARIYE